MTEEHYRRLSEMLDGELDDAYLNGCIRRLSSESECRERFSRYVLVRNCLRRDTPANASTDICDRVMTALEDEPVVLAPGNRARGRMNRVLKPVAGIAIAASVATVAVLGIRGSQFGEPGDAANQSAATQLAESSQSPDGSLPQVQYADARLRAPVAQTAGASDRAWLNNYLLRHNEAAGAVGGSGFIPYVHIVTREPGESAEPEPETGRGTPNVAQPE